MHGQNIHETWTRYIHIEANIKYNSKFLHYIIQYNINVEYIKWQCELKKKLLEYISFMH